jgi:hypothetical protein
VIWDQSDFEPVQICATGFTPSTLSSVPNLTRRRDGISAKVPYSGDPHLEQNARRFPGDDSYSLINSRQSITRKLSLHADAFVAKDEPLARRHIEQWQWMTGPNSPVISKRTPPQRHRPVNIQYAPRKMSTPLIDQFSINIKEALPVTKTAAYHQTIVRSGRYSRLDFCQRG